MTDCLKKGLPSIKNYANMIYHKKIHDKNLRKFDCFTVIRFMKKIKKSFLFCGILFVFASVCLAQSSPNFGQYEVAVKEIKPKKVDFKLDPQVKIYKKYLRDSTNEGINFAGQYVLKIWNCGNQCFQFGIIDGVNGKVFLPEQLQKVTSTLTTSNQLADFQKNSRLLILNNADGKKTFYDWSDGKLTEIVPAQKQTLPDVRTYLGNVTLPTFENLIPQFTNKTKVPVLLPANIPLPRFLPKVLPAVEGSEALTLYSSIHLLEENEYDLTIDTTKDCKGRPNCNYGHIAGKKTDTNAPVSLASLNYTADTAQPVSLSNGINGFYIPAPDSPKAVAGALVFWLDGKGNEYAVSLRRSPKEDVVSLANSVINNHKSGQ